MITSYTPVWLDDRSIDTIKALIHEGAEVYVGADLDGEGVFTVTAVQGEWFIIQGLVGSHYAVILPDEVFRVIPKFVIKYVKVE